MSAKEKPKRLRIVGLHELAQVAGIPYGTARTYRVRGLLPKPYEELACGPIYDLEVVEEWAGLYHARRAKAAGKSAA